jgi:hypothetical protein
MGARGVIVLMGNGHDEGERGRGFPTYMKFFNRIRAVQDFFYKTTLIVGRRG